ncbi:type II toxin-antitoxin system RelE/ParE family toxin [Roseiconus lacunae]|uniref:type II toxin-antitoxin system RelE/ParE family toxin n=1 Tax=Roseiconus lacunae TaxID=2605694 RepID=UPI001E35CB6A|nr:type II toxin-antitoxin system RelE/ParE family toxin [Roseiconus lacunae]MCD0461423.1 type II toxin-antitoxin system RelE/ParE family toxin [Roseiconus lacunae]
MPRIRLTASALSDLSEIWHYIAAEQQSPLNADSLADDFDERFQLIALHPHAGELVEHLRPGTRRSIVKKRFLVFYELEYDGILILRVLHGARLIRPEDLG